jgi:hypothetical protein
MDDENKTSNATLNKVETKTRQFMPQSTVGKAGILVAFLGIILPRIGSIGSGGSKWTNYGIKYGPIALAIGCLLYAIMQKKDKATLNYVMLVLALAAVIFTILFVSGEVLVGHD